MIIPTAAAFAPPISNAFPTTGHATIQYSSVQLATTTTPMGELSENSGIDPTFSTFGQWFFLIYVVVSLLAGGKEVWSRVVKMMDEKDK
jgi:predicted PurR-regulated permease PerM